MNAQTWAYTIRILIPIAFFVVLGIAIGILYARNLKKNMNRYKNVRLGMSEEEMLNIMGNKCSRSLLKENRVMYEWRYTVDIGISNDVSISLVGGARVVICVKDGLVEEVRPYNC